MCGIAGVVGKGVKKDRDMLIRMRDSMMHRGPDDAGEWWSDDGNVGLGMRRLAIIDLSPTGHQPMTDHAGDYVIVFNGEIYNYKDLKKELEAKGHRFATASDTEVILESYRQWGNDCVGHFNGMFAFAIYDLKARRLLFARDRAGEKPFFYCHENGVLWFGSELKSILASGKVRRDLNPLALEYYLSFGYVPGDMCLLDGFGKLLPAHAMTYDIESDRTEIWPYWKLPESQTSNNDRPEGLLEQFEELLQDSVRRQLVADVPVGIMLSGGVDSSLVTAMAARNVSNVRTFTVTFPGHAVYDEAPFAKKIANHFGTMHTELKAEEVKPEILFELARQYDEPIADSSMIPTYMLSKLIRRHATVALGGDGGDELFGGYLHYSKILRAAARSINIPAFIRSPFEELARSTLPQGFPYRNDTLILLAQHPHYLIRNDAYFENSAIEKVLTRRWRELVSDEDKMKFNTSGRLSETFSPLQQATGIDFLNYLSADVLVKVDRASMLASLEVRAPFLDHRVVEFAFGRVPDALKATKHERKILLKMLARKLLPGAFDLDRKQGFSVPLGDWFRKDWGRFMKAILFDESQQLFSKKVVRKLGSLQEKGIFNYQRLYALTMFELWRREYRINVP